MTIKYPIYIPTKGRWESCLTASMLDDENIPYYLVTEPQETDQYKVNYNDDHILTLPFSNLGSVTPARNWIKEHATKAGHKRHWQLDDDIKQLILWAKGKRTKASCDYILSNCETFVDRYSNVGIAGLKHNCYGNSVSAPFKINKQVYTCVIVTNNTQFWWRGNYGSEDTDFSLQVLSNNWCTILFQIFQFMTVTSGTTKGGNTDIYSDDGRMERARELQRRWSPYIGSLARSHGKPNYNINKVWRKFDQSLIKIKQ